MQVNKSGPVERPNVREEIKLERLNARRSEKERELRRCCINTLVLPVKRLQVTSLSQPLMSF